MTPSLGGVALKRAQHDIMTAPRNLMTAHKTFRAQQSGPIYWTEIWRRFQTQRPLCDYGQGCLSSQYSCVAFVRQFHVAWVLLQPSIKQHPCQAFSSFTFFSPNKIKYINNLAGNRTYCSIDVNVIFAKILIMTF